MDFTVGGPNWNWPDGFLGGKFTRTANGSLTRKVAAYTEPNSPGNYGLAQPHNWGTPTGYWTPGVTHGHLENPFNSSQFADKLVRFTPISGHATGSPKSPGPKTTQGGERGTSHTSGRQGVSTTTFQVHPNTGGNHHASANKPGRTESSSDGETHHGRLLPYAGRPRERFKETRRPTVRGRLSQQVWLSRPRNS